MPKNQTSKRFAVDYELTHEVIATILTDGLWGIGFDSVDYDEGDYKTAKEALLAEGYEKSYLTVEDVQARMLLDGKTIRLHMAEERPNEEWYDLTLDTLIDGLRKYGKDPINGTLWDVLKGDPEGRLDAYDYDAILQYACYGDVIIG